MEPTRAEPAVNELGRPLVPARRRHTLNVMDFNPPRQCRDGIWLGVLLLCWACMGTMAAIAVSTGGGNALGRCGRGVRGRAPCSGPERRTRVAVACPRNPNPDHAPCHTTAGDLMRLEAGMDESNNLCGVERPGAPWAVASQPYVYFACLPYGQRHPTVCTAECPHLSGQYVRWYNGSLITCELNGRTIPATTYPTTHLQQNCVPSAASLYALVSTEIDESALPSIVQGMRKSWWLVAACCAAAAPLALLWIAAARWLSNPCHLAGVTIAGTVLALFVLSCSLWYASIATAADADDEPVLQASLQVTHPSLYEYTDFHAYI